VEHSILPREKLRHLSGRDPEPSMATLAKLFSVLLDKRDAWQHLGKLNAIDITSARLTKYVLARREEKAANASIRMELTLYGKMLNLGLREGLVGIRPKLPTVAVSNTRSGFFEPDKFVAVVKALPAHLRGFIQFLYLTGWRRGEAEALQWRQVNMRTGVIRLDPGTTKNEEGRAFPFKASQMLVSLMNSQRYYTTLVEQKTGTIVPYVFHNEGQPIGDFRDSWRKACTAAEVPGKLVHDLRRTAVRNMERAGVPRSVAMQISGHKTESIYKRYAVTNENDLAEGIKKIERLHFGA